MNKPKQLTLSMLNCILITVIPVTKLVFLPSVLSQTSFEGSFLSAFICFIPEFIVAIAVFIANAKYKRPFYDLLKDKFGDTFSKIILLFYAIFYLVKATVLIFEQKHYIESTYYETTANFFSFMPFFILCFYISIKDIRILGKCSVITAFIEIAGLSLLLFLTIPSFNAYNLKPLFITPFTSHAKALYKSIFWFGDATYLLILSGEYKSHNSNALKSSLTYFLCATVVVIFTAVFYGVYGVLSKSQLFAYTQTAKYSIVLSNVVRFDYFGSLLLSFAGIFAVSMPVYFAVDIFREIFSLKDKILPSAIINAFLFAFVLIFDGKVKDVTVFMQKYLSAFMLITAYVLPLVICIKPIRKRSYEISKN